MLEFKMSTDLTAAVPKAIEFNFDELKEELAERLEYYNHLVITEDTIKEGKADRAQLNALRTAIDTRRKDIKKSYMQPYTEFEGRVKELTTLIDQPIKAIDHQLNAYEDQRKAEKQELIETAYLDTIEEGIREIIPLKMIMDKKWLNATYSMKKVTEDLISWSQRVNADLKVLQTVEPDYQAAVRAKYIERLDLAAALNHRDALKAADEAFKAAEKAEEKTVTKPQEVERKVEPEKLYRLRLEFTLTKKQAIELKKFLDGQNIEYYIQ